MVDTITKFNLSRGNTKLIKKPEEKNMTFAVNFISELVAKMIEFILLKI